MGDRKHDIERYLRGELSGEEMHALENEALNDPFLAEALEGIEQAGPDNFLYDLHQIRHSVHDRLHRDARRKTKHIRMWAWTGAIAATLLLIGVSGFIVLSLIRQEAARQQALNAEQEAMPVEFFEKDTLVIGLPPQRPVKRKINGPQTRLPARTADRSSDHSVPFTAEAEVETSEEVAAHDELPVAETTPGEAGRDAVSQTESIARSESTKAAQLQSEVPARENESISTAANTLVLHGRVVDADGAGLPGVSVMVKNTAVGTATNADGEYELTVPPGSDHLVFSFIGFESQEVAIDGRREVNVALNEDVRSLSEVVVSGYGSTSGRSADNTTFRSAEPIGGRNDFQKYLESAVKYPAEAASNKIEGKVTVRFTVEADGQLTNFEVIKGLGAGTEEALINAIKTGPAWKPGAEGDRPIADKVRVRYRFTLPK